MVESCEKGNQFNHANYWLEAKPKVFENCFKHEIPLISLFEAFFPFVKSSSVKWRFEGWIECNLETKQELWNILSTFHPHYDWKIFDSLFQTNEYIKDWGFSIAHANLYETDILKWKKIKTEWRFEYGIY